MKRRQAGDRNDQRTALPHEERVATLEGEVQQLKQQLQQQEVFVNQSIEALLLHYTQLREDFALSETKRQQEAEARRQKVARAQEERRLQEQRRLQEEQRAQEERRLQEQRRLQEELRAQEERRLQEQRRLQEDRRAQEERRLQEQRRLQEERRLQDLRQRQAVRVAVALDVDNHENRQTYSTVLANLNSVCQRSNISFQYVSFDEPVGDAQLVLYFVSLATSRLEENYSNDRYQAWCQRGIPCVLTAVRYATTEAYGQALDSDEYQLLYNGRQLLDVASNNAVIRKIVARFRKT